MTAATSRLRRRGIGAGVAALVGLTGLGLAAVPAQAAPGFDPSAASSRLAGVDRYDTAVKAALAGWTSASTVIVANGEVTGIDALAASYLAGVKDAPILLTAKDSVPAQTAAAITSLNPTTVIVLGDTNSVSASTYSALVGTKTGQRIDGPNRFQTAVDVMTEAGVTPPKTVFLARGDLYGANQVAADALAAGPAAFKNKIPVLLTNQNSLPAETLAALNTAGVTKVYVLGNANAISDAVYTQVDGLASVTDIERIQGSDRTATAAAIALEADFGFNKTGAALANGFRIDALAAGPVAGRAGSPILLTEGTVGLGVGTDAYLKANAATLTKAWVFGDANSVPTTITDAARTSAGGSSSVPGVAVSPATPVSLVVPASDDTTDDRTYSVAGLTAGATYRVTLVNANSIRTAADGSVTFLSSADAASPSGFSVDPGSRLATITVVNGSAVSQTPAAYTATAQPVNGNLSFTVDGGGTENIVPVVYLDGGPGKTAAQGGTSTRLETSATAAGTFAPATEPFGLGGQITFLPTEATTGVVSADAAITSVDKTANVVVTAGAVYEYQSNDRFFVNANNDTTADATEEVTADEFEAQLSAGDAIAQGSFYNATPELQSTFLLDDLAPAAPTVGTVTPSATGVNLTLTGLVAGATVTVYGGPDNNNAFDRATDLQRGQTVADQDATTAGFQITASGLTASTAYDLFVTQTVNGEESAVSGRIDTSTTAVAAPASPYSTAASLSSNETTSDNVLDADENLVFNFNSAITVAAGDTIRLIETDGDEATLTNGANATFTVSGAQSTVLTVDITGAPVAEVVRGNGVINTDAAVVAVVESTVGNAVGDWNVARSTDRTVVGTTLPTVLTTAAVNANASTEVVALGSGAGQADGDIVTVYNAAGVAIGTGTEDATGGLTITTTGFNPGDTLYITYRDASAEFVPSATLSYAVAPFITAGAITAGGTAGFGNNVGDQLTLTFSSAPTLAAGITGAGAVSEAEIEAITGPNTFTGDTGAFTAAVNGNTIVFTTATAAGTGALAAATALPGTANSTVTDVDGSGQVAAITPPAAS